MACLKGCCATQLDHYRSVNLSAAATPTRSRAVVAKTRSSKQFEKDRDAYKRLRKDMQPEQIDGSAKLEASL